MLNKMLHKFFVIASNIFTMVIGRKFATLETVGNCQYGYLRDHAAGYLTPSTSD